MRQCAFAVLVLVTAASAAWAERLTLKLYSTADGLPNNMIHRVVPDSRGFLWFCTGDGLSRFDGYTFLNYGLGQGLPSAIVTDLLETRAGTYWIATGAGLVRFDPFGTPTTPRAGSSEGPSSPRFATFLPRMEGRARHITSLFEDRAGGLWVGTLEGLYRATPASAGHVDFTFVDVERRGVDGAGVIDRVMEDRRGALWIAAGSGLYRRTSDGRIEAVASDTIKIGAQSLLEDRNGTIWVGTRDFGLVQVIVDPVSDRPTMVRTYTTARGLRSNWVTEIVQSKDGTLWAGSSGGLIQLVPTAGEATFQPRMYSILQGIPGEVFSLAEDRDRNLWLGLSHSGVAKLRHRGISTFDVADGLTYAKSPYETRTGEIVVLGHADGNPNQIAIRRFDGTTFRALGWLRGNVDSGWSWHQRLLQDRRGDWWIGTGEGVFRFSSQWRIDDLHHAPPTAIYTTRDGLSHNSVLCLFEDSRGDVWIATAGPPHGLSRWQGRTGRLQHYASTVHAPPYDRVYVSSIAEDTAGHLWIGYSGVGGLARLDGRARDGSGPITRFTSSDGVPAGRILNLLPDATGRLWASTDRAGLGRIDQPAAARPRFTTYTTADGLSSNATGAIAADRAGLIYVGTGRGIDRLDPATGRITHYSSADGVPGGAQSALHDSHGVIWFDSANGLVRLVPQADPATVSPTILITGIRIGARPLPISAVGERDVPAIDVPADTNQLQVEFVAPGSTLGEELRYQHRLDGATPEWSEPSDQRTVNFASLAPGAYRFLVRAVNADGVASPSPATLAFMVPPPIWQRWWFLTLAAGALAAVIVSLHRLRVVRLLEVANMRTRIATDLHDDIGANLTRIAILSEVARQQASADGNGHGALDAPLAGIARIARESVAGMSDIVWALSPDRDSLDDLVRKMREHVEEVFAARSLAVVFHAPDHGSARLAASLRRDVYLIFKEAVNNAARHARGSTITVELDVDRTHLRLVVKDDGVGFDLAADSDGLGLTSMRRRAERLGASLDIASRAGAGTTVTLAMGRHLPH